MSGQPRSMGTCLDQESVKFIIKIVFPPHAQRSAHPIQRHMFASCADPPPESVPIGTNNGRYWPAFLAFSICHAHRQQARLLNCFCAWCVVCFLFLSFCVAVVAVTVLSTPAEIAMST